MGAALLLADVERQVADKDGALVAARLRGARGAIHADVVVLDLLVVLRQRCLDHCVVV